MFTTEEERQLGLYFNKWPNHVVGLKVSMEEYNDFRIRKHKNIMYSKEGTVCNLEIDTNEHMKCIENWIRSEYVRTNCSKSEGYIHYICSYALFQYYVLLSK
jgi:hypothetical protein